MPAPFKHTGIFLIVLVTWLVAGGCGSGHPAPTYPVTGRVQFADGKPLNTGGIILFQSLPNGEQASYDARGSIAEDGTFQLSTFEEGDGAVAGKHRVLVRAQRDSDDYVKRGITPRPVIDPRFERFETSGLEFTVKDGTNDLTVVVERPGTAR